MLVVVGGDVGADWQPRFCQSAPGQLWLLTLLTTPGMTTGLLDSVKRLRVFREALYKIELIDTAQVRQKDYSTGETDSKTTHTHTHTHTNTDKDNKYVQV